MHKTRVEKLDERGTCNPQTRLLYTLWDRERKNLATLLYASHTCTRLLTLLRMQHTLAGNFS